MVYFIDLSKSPRTVRAEINRCSSVQSLNRNLRNILSPRNACLFLKITEMVIKIIEIAREKSEEIAKFVLFHIIAASHLLLPET